VMKLVSQMNRKCIWMERGKDNRPPWVKWYKTAAWHRLRYKQLSREPLCRFCKKAGIVEPATTVDHVVPHRGDMGIFFSGPFQSLCSKCHSSTKQRLEKSGEFGCDENGIVEGWK
jgi:5-methylcytosine-specific restriction endonuclease McrA